MSDAPRVRRVPPPVAWALGLFVLALGFRLAFGMPTDDWRLPHSAAFAGDAVRFLQQAEAQRTDVVFDAGLPMRGPGTAWLVGRLWSGTAEGVTSLRWAWCLLGAALAPLAYLGLRRRVSESVAQICGLGLAASHPLLVLSNTIDAETPYLLLVVAGLGLLPRRGEEVHAASEVLRGLCAALACLFRPEHLLIVVAIELVVVLRKLPLRGLALAITFAVLAPWERSVHETLVDLNEQEPVRAPANDLALRAVERLGMHVVWSEEAAAERDSWPAFLRRPSAAFVATTLAFRGRQEVQLADLAILEEAFGFRPQPLPTWPPLIISGPLNLALAHHDASLEGFHRGPLEQAPPMLDKPFDYPRSLVFGQPPPGFVIDYLPHLQLLLEGDEIALEWMGAHPEAARAQLFARSSRFVAGAAGGFGAGNWPFGASGRRGRADMVDPRHAEGVLSWLPTLLASLALLALLVSLRPQGAPEIWGWLLFLMTRAALALGTFGYVRFGALAAPVVLLGLALVLALVGRRARWFALIVVLVLLAVDLGTLAGGVRVQVDGLAPGEWLPNDPSVRQIDFDR